MKLIRLDYFLSQKNYCKSRSQAQDLIKQSRIVVNDEIINKPSFLMSEQQDYKIKIIDEPKYVSRAGEKLAEANLVFNISFENKVVLDIGASTGGFSDYALQNKAELVYCLDVGTDQLDLKIKNNPKTINLEKTNLKQIPNLVFSKPIQIILCDVSFISLEHVFIAIQSLLNTNVTMLFLIKPQFEISDLKIKKFKGKVNNLEDIHKIIEKIKILSKNYHLKLVNLVELKIKGKKLKNQEYFGYFQKWE